MLAMEGLRISATTYLTLVYLSTVDQISERCGEIQDFYNSVECTRLALVYDLPLFSLV